MNDHGDGSKNTKPSMIIDGLLCSTVFVLLAVAILLSGGGQAIANTIGQSAIAARAVPAEQGSCPPCEQARRDAIEAERVSAQSSAIEGLPTAGQDAEVGGDE